MKSHSLSGAGALLLLLLASLSSPLICAADAADPMASRSRDTSPVVVNGEVLTEVVGVSAYPARRRAREIAARIERLARDPATAPEKITVVKLDNSDNILYEGELIISVFDVDAAHLGLNDRHILSEAYLTRIREAIQEYRLDRSPQRLKGNVLQALLRTLALLLLLVVLRWLFRATDRLVERYFSRRFKKLEAKSMRVIQAEQVLRFVRAVLMLLKSVVTLGVIYFFLNFVLKLFPWTRYMAQRLLDMVIEPLQSMAFSFIDYLPSLFFLLILFFVTRYILRMLHGFFDAVQYQNLQIRNFEAEWAQPTYRIVRIVVLVFAVVVAYPYIPGSSSEAFKGVSLFLGVLLSLGSTSVISNIIAGYTMTYRRAFSLGDRVRIGETVGDVIDSRLLVTHLRSLKNEMVVIPNSSILNSEVVNYSALAKKENGVILHTSVGIGYEVPWRQVEAMLIEAARRTTGVRRHPAPFVLQTALTDFAVTYELNAYSRQASQMAMVYTDLHRNIQDVFNEYGVQIMTPNYVADTPEPKLVAREQWYAPPAHDPEADSGK
jgi:small-conductance mechanosensitive channel